MAFPFETTHLIAHLRASYLAQVNNDDHAKRIIKPINIKNKGNETEFPYPEIQVQESPPITFNIARHIQNSIHDGQEKHRSRSQAHKTLGTRKKEQVQQLKNNELLVDEEDSKGVSIFQSTPIIRTSSQETIETIEPEEKDDYRLRLNEHLRQKESSKQFELSYTKTISGNNKRSKASIARFFHHRREDKQPTTEVGMDSDSDDSIKTSQMNLSVERNLELIEEENGNDDMGNVTTDNGDATEMDRETGEISVSNNSDAITIDSDFGVPISSTGEDIGQDFMCGSDNETVKGYDKSEADEDEEDLEDEDEIDIYSDDEEDEDLSSTDSAFTDIEADSMLDSSILLDSYNDNNSPSYSFGNNNENLTSFGTDSKKSRKKKRANSFDTQILSKATTNSKNVSFQTSIGTNNTNRNNKVSSESNSTMASLSANKANVSGWKTIHFGKIDPSKQRELDTHPKNSNLSTMINSRLKSSNINPLNYYLFANSTVMSNSVHKTSLNIFLPPDNKPILSNLNINDNVAISDCIGYILLNLSKLDAFKNSLEDLSFLNPNNWRLELVDEDGENYGSFGILDRTRLLSSYHNLKELALCKVTDEKEILKNGKQSPLSMEFKESLLALQQKKKNINSIIEDNTNSMMKSTNTQSDRIELKIISHLHPGLTLSSSGFTRFYISVNATIGQLIKEFCTERGLEPSKYNFKEVIPKHLPNDSAISHNAISHKHQQPENMLLQGNLSNNLSPNIISSGGKLRDTDLVYDLQSDTLELVPIDNHHLQSVQELSLNDNSILNAGITPSESTYIIPFITPPRKKLEEKFQSLSLEQASTSKTSKKASAQPKENSTQNIKATINSNKYLDDIMTGKNSQLPTNLNTIYFKWKVWRKKTTILNKIEKSLIIDGDYIHLTPSDNTVFKKNPSDNPFTNQSEGNTQHHHHHHLYYYNYNNYYKESMMKTSSFHITQITKLKQYKDSKNPNHFKIVIAKQLDSTTSNSKDSTIKKKYDLEAVNVKECQEIIDKLKWVLQVYNMSNMTQAK